MLVLPGVVDVHTHTRVAIGCRAGPVLPGFGRGGVRRHDLVPVVQQPGHGSSPAAERSLRTGLAEWRAATNGDSAIDYGLCARGLRPRRRPARRAPGHDRCRGRDLEGVHGLRLPPGRPGAVRCDAASWASAAGCSRSIARIPVLLDAAVAAALQRGDVSPRYHATSRPPYVEAVATARALAFARATERPSTSSTSRRPPRSTRCGAPRRPASGSPPRPAPTTWLTDEALRRARPGALRLLRHLAAACGPPPIGTRCGRGWPTARSTSSPPTTSRTASASRRPRRRAACRSTRSATARRASRPCWRSSTARASPAVGSRSSGWSTSSPPRRRHVRSRRKGALEVGGTPTSSSSIRTPADAPRHRPPPHERLHAVRGDRGQRGRPRRLRPRRRRHPGRRLRRPPRLRPVRRARRDRRLISGAPRAVSRVSFPADAHPGPPERPLGRR